MGLFCKTVMDVRKPIRHGVQRRCVWSAAVAVWMAVVPQDVCARESDSDADGEPARAGETIFDFISGVSRAHLRRHGLVLDFGGTAHYKYIVGDWHHSWQDAADASDFTTLRHRRGEIRFVATAEDTDAGTIGIRGRAGTAGRVGVVFNRVFLGELSFSNAFEYQDLSIPGGVHLGENVIELLPKTDAGNAGKETTFDVDYIRIQDDDSHAAEAAVSMDALSPITDETGKVLVLGEDDTLSYNLFIPENAHLTLAVSSSAPLSGHLEIQITSNERRDVFDIDPSDAGVETVSLSLASFAGAAATLSFQAMQETIQVTDARLEVDGVDFRHSVQHASKGATRSPPLKSSPLKNVLVVVVDTLRRDRLKVYQRATKVQGPALERLARRSVVFENAFAQSNWTKPSVATLFTGLFPQVHGAVTHLATLPDTLETLPVYFKRNGFDTAGFVANGYISEKFGFGNGWDYLTAFDGSAVIGSGRQLVMDAVRWITKRRERPFFAYVHTIDVHAPYQSPSSMISRYDPQRYSGIVRSRETAGLLNMIRAGSVFLGLRDVHRLIALYDSAVAYHDIAMGYLFRSLESAGVLDDTVVVFTADHGEEFYEHGSVGHGHTLHDELIHVPLIIRIPSQSNILATPRRLDTPVGLIDVFPTLCDLLHLPKPSGVQGQSFSDVLETYDVTNRGPVISESPSLRQVSLMYGRFKSVFSMFDAAVYDTSVDPLGRYDRSEDYPFVRNAMTDLLGDYLATVRRRPLHGAASVDSVGVRGSAKIDADTEARLQALGYMGD